MARIVWLRHASVLLDGSKRVYIDPWEIKKAAPADLVLITHDHYDHLSLPDLKAVCGAATEICVPEAAISRLAGVRGKVHGVRPGQELTAATLRVEVLAAYNVSKKFHPREAHNVGYVVTLDGERIYHAGDTDRIPEMKGIAPDVALLPVGGTYTMTAEEAAQAVSDLQAKRAIPIHFGAIVGDSNDAARFKALSSVPVEILEPRDG
jgi:L-ascorbate metabolism protein UlaG (beta-lactamase superfamily)